jgi:hypothetical protein
MRLFREKDGNCHVFANSCWEILPLLLLAGCGYSQRLFYTLKEFLRGCPIAFGHYQWLSYTLLAVPSGCSTAFKSISQAAIG